MPNPLLWGALAAVLNFLPYIGSATTLVLLTLVAFVSFDTIGRVALVAGSYLALATIEGQVVEPLFLGRRLALNPLIVFLALWFGGWFWGISGIILAVPSVVVVKVSAEHAKRGRPLQEFLSPEEVARRFSARNVGETLRARGRARARARQAESTIVEVAETESIEQARQQAEIDRADEQRQQAR